MDISEVIEHLKDEQALLAIAQEIIETHTAGTQLHDNPDDYREHSPPWHQHGIVTHSLEFAKAMETSIPNYVKEWGLETPVDTILSDRIDGVQKRQLLVIASLFHDIGKFTARTTDHTHDEASHHFTDHEEHSGALIRTDIAPYLNELGLTEAHVEYIAKCAELHFELGKVRRVAKQTGYTMAFADSPQFEEAARTVIREHPGFAVEIGLQFIADNLSKSEVFAVAETDEEIEAQRPALVQELNARGLHPALINQALQMPVNFKVARNYLRLWAEEHSIKH